MGIWPAEVELRARHEAMAWLTVRTNDGVDPISSEDLKDFEFDGDRLPLIDVRRGIRKPAAFRSALSILTVYRPPGAPRPYEDLLGSDGLIRYKWRGDDGMQSENRALREAMSAQVPLIWLFGVGSALYKPIYPVYILGEEPEQQQFLIAPEAVAELGITESPVEEHLRRYLIRETKQRVHQPVFRATVMRAYHTQCAVCALRHGVLLDAAHIVPDAHERGVASVRNGLALCKIHHAAFDARILGIRPDCVVQIRADLLEEIDGPMLQHGLKERHGRQLMVVPRSRRERPDPELLEMQYEAFRSAG